VPVRANCLADSKQCERGWVNLEIDVAPSGKIEQVEVVEACPDQSFNWTAVNNVRKWKYKPSPAGKQDLQVRLCRP
jgi:TonB family protein